MASPDTDGEAESESALAYGIPTHFSSLWDPFKCYRNNWNYMNSGEIDGIIEKLDGISQFYWVGRGEKCQSSCRTSTMMPKTNYQWWGNHKPTIC